MKILHIIVALILTASAYGRTVPRIALQCETSRPSSVRLDLVHGETVDLAVRLSNYGSLLDITGATVTLHARTNGMAEGSSWQVPGEASTTGIALVSLDVDAWIPRSVGDGTWTIEIVQPSTARILRAGGILRVADTAAASTNDPVPSLWLTDIRAEIADAVAELVLGHTMVPVVLGSDGAIFEPNLDGGIITQQGTFTNFTVEALLYEMVGTPSVPWQSFENPKTFPFFIGDMTKYWIGNWRGTGTNRYPYIIYSDNGSSEDATWYGVPGGTYPQTLTLVSGSGGGTATVNMTVTNRMLHASVLTDLTGYARMTGTEIGDGFVVLSPNLNESVTISHTGVGYYSMANGLIDIGWPLSTGTIATMQDVTNATAGVAMYSQLTNAISDLNTSWVTNEIHKDSFTNLLWKSVFSNGWHWLVAYTNTP